MGELWPSYVAGPKNLSISVSVCSIRAGSSGFSTSSTSRLPRFLRSVGRCWAATQGYAMEPASDHMDDRKNRRLSGIPAKAALPSPRRRCLQSGAFLSFPSPHSTWLGARSSLGPKRPVSRVTPRDSRTAILDRPYCAQWRPAGQRRSTTAMQIPSTSHDREWEHDHLPPLCGEAGQYRQERSSWRLYVLRELYGRRSYGVPPLLGALGTTTCAR